MRVSASVYDFVLGHLAAARWSDLHLQPGEPLRVRGEDLGLEVLDGGWTLDEADFDGFAKRLTTFGDQWLTALTERQGNLDCSAEMVHPDLGTVRFRANFFFCGAGRRRPALVMRRIATHVPSLVALQVPAVLPALLTQANGLVLVTGATGSGKSTTLAACIEHINAALPAHVVTLEDPVEYLLRSRTALINQREIGPGKDCPSFEAGLRAVLREDPDVIMVGEIRDRETAQLALLAALTGHLVLGTLHTRSAIETVDRFTAMFPGDVRDDMRAQLAGALRAVFSQALLPGREGGRVLACEVMLGTPAIASLLRDGKKTHQIANEIRQGGREGMCLLNERLLQLVMADSVDAEVALASAYDPKELADRLAERGRLPR